MQARSNKVISNGFKYLSLIAAVALSGCVMIPYETPEAKAQIAQDLQVAPGDIQAMSETNWCLYPYGSDTECKATQGLGVLTRNGLILSLYKDKTYQPVATLKNQEVNCARTDTRRDAEEIFVVFTDKMGVMLAPITPGGSLNLPAKKQFFDYLLARSQPLFTGKDGAFNRDTGQRRGPGDTIPGTMLAPHMANLWVAFNPCPSSP